MRGNDIFPAIFWLGIGVGTAVISYKLKLGSLEKVGPGLVPFGLGIILSICSLTILVPCLIIIMRKEKQGGEAIWSGVNFKRLILVVASLLGYAMFLERIGFLLTTFFLMLILFKTVDSQKWFWALITSVLTVVILFFIFVVFFKVELPWGFWRIRGL